MVSILRMDPLRIALEAAGFGPLAEHVLAAATPEVHIRATRSDAIAIGASRIGGTPDLPRGTPWPRHRWTRAETRDWPDFARAELATAIDDGVVLEEPEHLGLALPFVAQLDLAQLAPLQDVLPRRGHLWLFADQMTEVGMIADYVACASACLFAEDTELVRVEPPPVPDTLPAFALEFLAGRALPNANDLGLDGSDWHRYHDTVKTFEQPKPRHACLVRPSYGSIAPVPADGWTGILRVDSNDAGGAANTLAWGDAAWITFAIPNVALAARRFDEMSAFRWYG